jgi:serine/threonine protein kinase
MNLDRLVANRYRVCAELGSGGFGAVYRVEDTHAAGAMRALKTLKPNASISQLAERFTEEARALSSLKHAGVPKCWDFGEDEEIGLYFVLDYIEGQTLLDRMESGSMSLAERFQRAIEFFDVLGHVHGRGILHRDIKPENLMVPKDGGHLILLDFGIAKDLAQSAVHTATGVILGTPYYLTPEQLMGERYTAKSDMYQAALVTYWLLTGGSHCFAQVDSIAQLMAQRQMVPRAGALERTSWHGRIRGLVRPLLECLEPKPADRPGTARIVRDALSAMRDAVVGEGRVDPPTSDGVTGPVRKVSSKVSKPTAVQTSAGSTPTAVAQVPSIPSRTRTPPGVPVPETPGENPASLPLRAIAGVLVVTLIATGSLIVRALSQPRVEHSPSPVTSPSASPSASGLIAVLDETVGADGTKLDGMFRDPALKSKATPADVAAGLEAIWGAERLARLRQALTLSPRITLESGTADERKLLSGLLACQTFDMLADSAGAPRPLGDPLAKALGSYAGQEYYPSFERMPAFGRRLWKSIREDDVEHWKWDLPPTKAPEVMVAVLLTKFHPKTVLEVSINRSTRVYFHNGEGRSGEGSFRIQYQDLGDPKMSGLHDYHPTKPQQHYVVIGRRLPRSVFTSGLNSLSFRFLKLPGPLKLADGRAWKHGTDASSLWGVFVGFKVD